MYVPSPIFTPDGPEYFDMDDAVPLRHSTSRASTTSSSAHSKNERIFKSMVSNDSSSRQPRTLAPNLTRRSHKKSRAGCFTCKSRKIKCGEQKPKCGNCMLKGLSCVYPAVDTSKKREVPFPLAKRTPSGTTPATASFTLLDMRFFHHFLTTAYPHLPLGNDHIWVNEIPQIAESQEYLMHAILSLGASHLARVTETDYRKEALQHRGLAIAGLNHALSQRAQHYGEGDAMLAACYALTFQASYMGDGLADFITMVRGCALTTGKIQEEEAPTAFNLQPDWHWKIMAPRLQHLPRVNSILLEDGLESLDNILPLMSTDLDYNFHAALVNVLSGLLDSPGEGYQEFTGVYGVWYELCHDSFQQFLDPSNLTAQLLLSYFLAIQMLMVPLAAYEWPERANSSQAKVLYGTVEWAEGLFERIEESDLGSMDSAILRWPKRIVGCVVRELGGEALLGDEADDILGVLGLDKPINWGRNQSQSQSHDTSPDEGLMDVNMGHDQRFEEELWAQGIGARMIPDLMGSSGLGDGGGIGYSKRAFSG